MLSLGKLNLSLHALTRFENGSKPTSVHAIGNARGFAWSRETNPAAGDNPEVLDSRKDCVTKTVKGSAQEASAEKGNPDSHVPIHSRAHW